ncbi:TBC1 domain family member 2A isoform X2 [Sagmatias obliquidens]|uniref:TBC1 domain family member 2A isoform X2 n=1 Tax=Sagmatias obliquidens TaxID=3371155 RepID=UPI000F441118|nr:TBC1 domain family member 2A isoform X2 [Lagenorhynchus obliquidens]
MADRHGGKAGRRRGGRSRQGACPVCREVRMGVASSPYWAFHQGGAHTAASRVPPSSPGGGSPLAPPLSGKLPLGRYHPSFRDLTGVGPQASSPSTMESTQEKPAESSSPVPGSEEPAGLARDPEVLPPKESEGCARPLETAPKKICGYLSKFGGKGPIRGWKSRWFFYDERKCHLYYSRTAQDANPLDSIDLSSAVFDCKADAEEGTFEIKTPSRIITLKAATKQAMLYWLQQLQMKRWEFHNSPPAPPAVPDAALAGNGPALRLELEQEEAELEEFLCPVKTPTGLVGMAAALQPVPAMPLALQNISLKHLGTEIQNTMYNIRGNKQTQGTGHRPSGEDSSLSEEPQREEQPSPPDLSAPGKDPADSPKPTPKSSLTANLIQKAKRQSNTFPLFTEGLTRNRTAQEKVLALEQQVLMLTKELKAQKELVKILHKALEAAQQEKRVSSAYLAAAEDKDRLELVRHKVRQIAELGRRVEALEQERESLVQTASLREQEVQELRQHVQLLLDKNQAKQEVIQKLSEKVTQDFMHPPNQPPAPPDAADRDLLSQQEKMEHLKDDMEAYRTQNRFLNSEIHQVTRIWRKVAEKEKALLMKCAYLQAKNCQVESKYLAGLRRLQEAVGVEAGECSELLRQLIQEALQWEASEASADSVVLSPIRLAAIALLVLDEEESAFWCLVAIVETIMPADYYSKTLLASQVDQRVLQDLLLEKLPKLMAHLGQHRVDLSFVTFNWLLVVFADSLISNILLQVWDAFLYEGTKVVFRYALAIFKYNEEEILRLQDGLEIYQYLRFFTKTICNSRKLMNIAFNDMNPFPMKQLRQLRMAHRERLEAELHELEQLKAKYLETRAAQGPAVPEGCTSEDEGEAEP